mmetsp:Transcript_7035/g.22215  ORF Transcript_7035/g.22215 Transcript_7035/m.22215 type:complete len:219 (+) Transcript_7035:935-1591(+)
MHLRDGILPRGPAPGQFARVGRRPDRPHRLRASQADLRQGAGHAGEGHVRPGDAAEIERRAVGRRRGPPRALAVGGRVGSEARGRRAGPRGPRGRLHVALRRRARAVARRLRAERAVAQGAGPVATELPAGPGAGGAVLGPHQGPRGEARREMVPGLKVGHHGGRRPGPRRAGRAAHEPREEARRGREEALPAGSGAICQAAARAAARGLTLERNTLP